MVRTRFWAAALLLVVASSCSSKSETEPGSSGESGRYKAPPPMTIDSAKSYKAAVLTSKGTIELSLDAKAAPITVNNFVFLARERYYDGLVFHRVEPGFVVQGGDPSGTGSGGPGYTIADEPSPLLHEIGALGMAKSTAPNSAGSQFYITLSAQPSLDGRYTVFGKVAAGLDVAQKIARGDVIQRITITEN
jgi:peptidyl-prolyl cis-trans isomerase B (cyclophilin B)